MTFPYRTTGRIAHDAEAALAAVRRRAEQWDIPLDEGPDGLSFRIWNSLARLKRRDADAAVELGAPEERLLRTLQGALAELLEEHGLTVEWEEVAAGALAPGLSLMTVASVTPLSPGFIRVRLAGPEAARFAAGGLHFRLLQPPHGRPPRWPRISASGRTVWPEGEDALHRPVYTTVAQADDWLDFDIFRHAGSPTCDWADRDPVGETVGVMGPGGGMCPEGSPLVLFGDQTALPAIRRMLALAAGEVTAFVQAAPADMDDLSGDRRVRPVEDLLAALEAAETPAGGHVWFAAHAEAARAARGRLIARGLSKRDFTAAAYWS